MDRKYEETCNTLESAQHERFSVGSLMREQILLLLCGCMSSLVAVVWAKGKKKMLEGITGYAKELCGCCCILVSPVHLPNTYTRSTPAASSTSAHQETSDTEPSDIVQLDTNSVVVSGGKLSLSQLLKIVGQLARKQDEVESPRKKRPMFQDSDFSTSTDETLPPLSLPPAQ